MKCDDLSRALLLWTTVCAVRAQSAAASEDKVSFLLEEEPTNPKCFTEALTDFKCFWEDNEERPGSVAQYTLTYRYQTESSSSSCPLRAVTAAGRKLLLCHLNRTKVFVQMFIQVRREGKQLYNRSLLVDQLLFLDPPANVTARGAAPQAQLNVSWLPPPVRYIDDSLMYQVSYAAADGPAEQVEVVVASTKLKLRGLRPSTAYRVRVRAKPDGVTYDGYWSAWSQPVLVETPPAEADPLIISLTLIISLILTVLSLSVFLSHRRFLQKKIWPTIPTPDNKFHGLFSVHGGDFKEWLRQTSGGLWSAPAVFYSEECPDPLDVLSELSVSSSLPPPPASRKEDVWPTDPLRALHQHHVPCSPSLLESKDAYVTLSTAQQPRDPLDESHSDLGSVQHSSGSGRLSSQSSFEYPSHGWLPKGPGYIYMAGADSGVSMDYSPMSRAEDTGKLLLYANDVPAFQRACVCPR